MPEKFEVKSSKSRNVKSGTFNRQLETEHPWSVHYWKQNELHPGLPARPSPALTSAARTRTDGHGNTQPCQGHGIK